ncbi:MAG: aspartyl protease family protein [Rhodospirillaceae bacterium]
MHFRHKVTRRQVMALFGGSVCAWPARSQDQTHRLDVGFDSAARVTVPVSIGGKGPFPFIVDTASERTVIASELAEYLQLAKGRKVQVHTVSGPVISETLLLPKFEIDGLAQAPKAAPHFAQRNIGAMGIVGLDVLKSQRIVLDFRRATVAMNAEPSPAPNWEGESILVTARSRLGQLVLTNAGLGPEDESIWVVIDTGAQFSIGNETLRRFVMRERGLGQRQKMDLISVSGEKMEADYIVVRRLRIGGMIISQLPIAFADVHPFRRFGLMRERALLLGMDVLRQFDQIGLNFANRTVRFFWSPREG